MDLYEKIYDKRIDGTSDPSFGDESIAAYFAGVLLRGNMFTLKVQAQQG